MARTPQAPTHKITIDGVDYFWNQRHEWSVWGKGVKAVSVSVALVPGKSRELILDISFKVEVSDRQPSDAKVGAAVEDATRAALEDGWKPDTRGRAFRYEITEPYEVN
jgi:hypothetical protein